MATNGHTNGYTNGTHDAKRILHVGVIGCGEIAQVAHIPNYNFLRDKYQVTYLCDVSQDALQHCARMVQGGSPKTTTDPEELCASPDVDVVLICSGDEYHVTHGLIALKHDKWTLIEKPLSFSTGDIDALITAEKKSKGKVFVGTMRRFATAFHDACREVGGVDKVLYARVRSIIGPNTNFVNQSGTYPQRFTDYSPEAIKDKQRQSADVFGRALEREIGVANTPEARSQLFILGSLNSHDISAMRDIIGMPKRVLGASLGFPGIYSALFEFDGFAVNFESGINSVPVFDANIEVYGEDKIVRIQYDSPYVRGLPVTMHVREKVESRQGNDSFGYQERFVRRTYEDPYTLQMLEFYDCMVHGKPIKTTAQDSKQDLEIFKMILKAGEHSYRTGQ
jgi:predicted dehydrogenase